MPYYNYVLFFANSLSSINISNLAYFSDIAGALACVAISFLFFRFVKRNGKGIEILSGKTAITIYYWFGIVFLFFAVLLAAQANYDIVRCVRNLILVTAAWKFWKSNSEAEKVWSTSDSLRKIVIAINTTERLVRLIEKHPELKGINEELDNIAVLSQDISLYTGRKE